MSKGRGRSVHRSTENFGVIGMEIIDSDLDSLRLEAVATSFWFDSKMMFWCKLEYEDASLAEIRSVSRVGVSDLGANAARIYRILDELKKIDA